MKRKGKDDGTERIVQQEKEKQQFADTDKFKIGVSKRVSRPHRGGIAAGVQEIRRERRWEDLGVGAGVDHGEPGARGDRGGAEQHDQGGGCRWRRLHRSGRVYRAQHQGH